MDIWLRVVVRIDGTKMTKAILLPKNKSNPESILELFTEIEKLVKKPKSK